VSQRPLGCLFEVVETLVLTLVIFLIIQNFVAQPYQVQQMSMENTLQPGEYVLVDKLTPRLDDYSRGDVVVFTPPAGYDQGGNTPFIKRVIGLPGDTIDVRDGQVLVDGKPIVEPYTFPGSSPYQPTIAPPDRAEWTIGPDELFVLGDHREQSSDSRVFGPIKRDSVIGRAWLRYWPFNVFGILQTPTYPELQAATP
jgi:signal peptidase I